MAAFLFTQFKSKKSGSIPEVHKLNSYGKILCPHSGNHCLQFIPALAVDAHFIALDLRGDFEFSVADEAGDLLGHGALDAVLDLDDLPGVAERREVGVALLHALETDAALGELADDHFVERADFEIILGAQLDLGFLQNNFRLAAFEIEAVGEFLFRLVHGVLDFHGVDLGDDVE